VKRKISLAVRDDRVITHLKLVPPIAIHIAGTLPRCFEVDDLVGYGMLGLMRAAERFDPRRNVSFDWYARREIERAIRDSLRRRKYRQGTGQESLPAANVYCIDRQAGSRSEGSDQLAMQDQSEAQMAAALNELTPDEKTVIGLHYFRGWSLARIGRDMGIEPRRVSDIHTSGLDRMHGYFELRGRKAA